MKELRLGHDKMPVSKKDDVMQEVPVKKYGLNGAHHILLEGSTFPPEKRSSMAQSMGPMTAYLCMIRSEGIYRDKWASAVKRAFNHIPIIDDIIEVTKGQRKAADVSTMTGLLAEICLITTSRQATRAFFPLAMIHRASTIHAKEFKQYCEYFNTTGSGAFYTYKLVCGQPWTLTGAMKEEVASQIVFHSIFGTFKEDLSILSEITNLSTWFTREEFGKCFRKGDKIDTLVRANLPVLKYYAKMSCANQSGLLTGVYNQVSSIPCFNGRRVQKFGSDFFEHIQRKVIVGSTGKSISQIVSSLSIILDDLRKRVNELQGSLEMGTTEWRNMSDLSLGQPGTEIRQERGGVSPYPIFHVNMPVCEKKEHRVLLRGSLEDQRLQRSGGWRSAYRGATDLAGGYLLLGSGALAPRRANCYL
ncbi:unnamed protein product [Colias eurytheme]|nr:unnamed protein product [Colias eurytheme]